MVIAPAGPRRLCRLRETAGAVMRTLEGGRCRMVVVVVVVVVLAMFVMVVVAPMLFVLPRQRPLGPALKGRQRAEGNRTTKLS